MKKTLLPMAITTFIMITIVFSCKKNDLSTSNNQQSNSMIGGKVEEQLKLSEQNLASHQLPLKILSYKFESTIQTDDQLAAAKAQLLDDNDLVPQYDGTNVSSFSLNTMKECINASIKDNEEGIDVVQNIQSEVFPLISKGQKLLDISWDLNGKQFVSKCIYNEDGIVYDNILSNIIFFDSDITTQDSVKPSLDNSTCISKAVDKTEAQYSFTATVLNYTIKWIWGSTRGKIIIKHYIIWNGINYIYDHGGSAEAWMSLGSAKARWANNYLARHSRSKMAWAYGWATPTASFSITFHTSTLTFSTSTSGIGSRGSGSGIHTIYLP